MNRTTGPEVSRLVAGDQAREEARDLVHLVVQERQRQGVKWGEQNHDPAVWLAILMEEVGELGQAVLAERFGVSDHSSHLEHSDGVRTEAIQVAAVALALLGYLERRPAPRLAADSSAARVDDQEVQP